MPLWQRQPTGTWGHWAERGQHMEGGGPAPLPSPRETHLDGGPGAARSSWPGWMSVSSAG